ncbi:MAG: AbrB/MazE/SpoVT family DNA-binding domain-containing protein [Gammaproteobacteria bacterium]|nr:AbrB/MazE/SpoVT family DNA-binding domain-containing protein [Gammaproteobacteria bacterium]MCY3988742.1 AbrB/MazE/SpoVT family DNA-binding domain-containing protein [Gammaproteobacteria bacterium]
MPALERLMTTVSTQGQIILPKAIRQALGWEAGEKLIVEQVREGVVLRPLPMFAATTPSEVFGYLRFGGASKTVEKMNAGIPAEAKRRHEGG